MLELCAGRRLRGLPTPYPKPHPHSSQPHPVTQDRNHPGGRQQSMATAMAMALESIHPEGRQQRE